MIVPLATSGSSPANGPRIGGYGEIPYAKLGTLPIPNGNSDSEIVSL